MIATTSEVRSGHARTHILKLVQQACTEELQRRQHIENLHRPPLFFARQVIPSSPSYLQWPLSVNRRLTRQTVPCINLRSRPFPDVLQQRQPGSLASATYRTKKAEHPKDAAARAPLPQKRRHLKRDAHRPLWGNQHYAIRRLYKYPISCSPPQNDTARTINSPRTNTHSPTTHRCRAIPLTAHKKRGPSNEIAAHSQPHFRDQMPLRYLPIRTAPLRYLDTPPHQHFPLATQKRRLMTHASRPAFANKDNAGSRSSPNKLFSLPPAKAPLREPSKSRRAPSPCSAPTAQKKAEPPRRFRPLSNSWRYNK